MSAVTATPRRHVDLAILGGGLAGLSLAQALAGSGLSVAILEARADYASDRTWSFWCGSDEPRPWPGEQGRWQAWRVRRPGQTPVVRESSGWHYVSLDAGAWQREQCARIAASREQVLYLATPVVEFSERGDGIHVTTADAQRTNRPGPTVVARHVVDCRLDPGAPRSAYGQHFLGYEVESEHDLFDATTVDLMDFRPGAMPGDGVDFVYLLPFTPRRALVEVTRFAVRPPPPSALSNWLRSELRQLGADQSLAVRRHEAASLPMQPLPPPRSPLPGRYLALGQSAGANRGATGYAFRRLQCQCRLLAAQLVSQRRLPVVAPDPGDALERWMDRLFLHVIRQRPDRAAELFARLFARCPPERLVRFLNERPRALDRCAVIAACTHAAFFAGLSAPR